GPGELRDAGRALDVISLANEGSVRHALRAVLSGTREQAALFDRAFAAFFFPGAAGLRQDEMPSTRREPGSGGEGRDAEATDVPSHSHPDAEAHEPSGLGSGPMTPFETPDGPEEEAQVLAPSSYSPLAVDRAEAPGLPRVGPVW